MRLLIRDHFRNALNSLKSNRGRSFLTVLGIAIGIASIIVVMSLSGGINNLIKDQVKAEGGNLVLVRPKSHGRINDDNIFSNLPSGESYARSTLTKEDVESVQKLDGVIAAAPLAVFERTLKGDNEVPAGSVVATNTDISKALQLKLKEEGGGQFFDDSVRGQTAVIGSELAMRLFDSTTVIGKNVYIKGEAFMIIGVLDRIDDPINFNNVDFDNSVILKMDQLGKIETGLQIQQINVKVESANALKTVSDEIYRVVRENHVGEDDFLVAYGDDIGHSAESLFSVIGSMLTVVAAVSLVVGGIGVMNIMLVSVAERTREIGIRKAVGAGNVHILMQFLFESLILSLLGGVLGLAFGYAFSYGLSLFTPFVPAVTWEIVGVVAATSLIVGCFFGIYPALKAAKKNPIESLRYYR